jgi:peroxiredoxin Q/BCP
MKTPTKTALACVLALLAACQAPAPTSAPPETSATAASQATAAPSAGPTPSSPTAAPSASAAAQELADDLVDKPAPDFTTTAQNGTSVHLGALKGKRVVLYFYPKDETPGCTKEACSFRDAWQDLAKTGAVLIGVSADTTESHRAFVAHYKLPFLLVSDPDGAIAHLYGVPFAGHHDRQTVVIRADGTVGRVYRRVDVAVHAAQVLDDLSHA